MAFVDPTSRRGAAALVLAAALTLGACTNGTPTAPPSTTTTSTTPATTSTATTPASPTTTASSPSPTTNTLAQRFPETAAGAEAFVEFFFSELNAAYSAANPAPISDLVLSKSCSDCTRWLIKTGEMHQKQERFDGTFVTVDRPKCTLPDQRDESGCFFRATQPKGAFVDASGRTVEARAASGPISVIMRLDFSGHWRVADIGGDS